MRFSHLFAQFSLSPLQPHFGQCVGNKIAQTCGVACIHTHESPFGRTLFAAKGCFNRTLLCEEPAENGEKGVSIEIGKKMRESWLVQAGMAG